MVTQGRAEGLALLRRPRFWYRGLEGYRAAVVFVLALSTIGGASVRRSDLKCSIFSRHSYGINGRGLLATWL